MYDIFISSFSALIDMFLPFVLLFLRICFIILVPFVVSSFMFYIYFLIKGYRKLSSDLGNFKEPCLLYKVFVLFPKQLIYDYFTIDPNIFDEYGIYIVVGRQGCGKSTTMAYLLNKWRKIYKRLKIISNMGYKYEDAKLIDVNQLSLDTNGIYGEVDVIDEVQSFLGLEFSKNFPENFKKIIHQQRKVRRCILCGTQNFDQVAKPIRLQCKYVFMPRTYFGCFTVVKQYLCKLDNDAQLITDSINKPLKTFCFVHDEKLRESFDSYKTVDRINVNDCKVGL